MAYDVLKNTVANALPDNTANLISPADVRNSFNAVINSLGAEFQFGGEAKPTDAGPGTPDYKVAYLASTPGTYSNFGGITLADGEVAILKWAGSWSKETTGIATTGALAELNSDIALVKDAITKFTYEQLVAISDVTGKFIKADGSEGTNAGLGYFKFSVTGGEMYAFSGRFTAGYTNNYMYAFGAENEFLGVVGTYRANDGNVYDHERFIAPANAAYITLNYRTTLKGDFGMWSVGAEIVNSSELDERISALESMPAFRKKMRVVVQDLAPVEGSMFYVRAHYNAEKDIIMTFRGNGNGIISPMYAYVGGASLADGQIMTSANLMNDCSDSIGPLFNSSVYWHLFANHGYVVPTINNSVGMTAADVGAKWKDQLNREYFIGSVDESTIILLPVIYQDAGGNDTRDWKTPSSPAIEELTHVSGGDYTTPFFVSGASRTQLRPIMKSIGRELYADGVKISEPGTYECDDFKANETQIGYDPASIPSFFPPALNSADVMAIFTWSYNFFGPTYCVNTTIDIRKKVEFQSYGATQQQFFFDKVVGGDTYKAMFLIPKAAARNGIEYDKPFNLPNSSQPGVVFFRTAEFLKDVNNPIDRLIGYLHDTVNGKYLFGAAAGLSLVSGDTVTVKRVQNMAIGSANSHYRVGSVSPENRNKFYIAAFNTSLYEEDGYMAPATLFREINYYVSYFDPAQNIGQVYWYKDGRRFVIYAHCQTAQDRVALNVPQEMEGLSLNIVEKTDGATLLTETIQNGRIFVSYTNEANYIVMTAE